jgi:outer membrane receptor protein involved in Fe transport
MKSTLLFYSFFACLLLLASLPLSAQTDTIRITKMDKLGVAEIIEGKAFTEEKVVGASRSEKKLQDLPITVYVITQEEIHKNGYTTLVDVLKMVPGVRVGKVGSGVSGEMFMMRGLEGNVYTKILLNSLPIQPSASSSLGIGEQLPIAQVDRIEVIYGTASAVYGADAMAGVVNIITKNTQNSTFANINAITGEYGYKHVNFMAGGKLGRNKDVVQYTFYGNRGVRTNMNVTGGDYNRIYNPLLSFSDSLVNFSEEQQLAYFRNSPATQAIFALTSPSYKGTPTRPTFGNLEQESYLFSTHIKYRGFQLSFTEMYRSDPSSLGRQPMLFGYHDSESRIGEKTQITALNYTKNVGKFAFTSNLMYLRNRFDNQSAYTTNYTETGKSYTYQASDDFFGEGIVNYQASKKLELTGGVSYKLSSSLPITRDLEKPFDTEDYAPFSDRRPKPHPLFGNFGINPVNSNNFGAFAQAYYSSKKWNILLGWRYDSPSNYQSQSYQRLAIMYRLSQKTSIRISGGYAFKAPPLNLAYFSVAIQATAFNPATQKLEKVKDSVSYQVVPNPNLNPEEAGYTELGLRYTPNSNIYLDAYVFINGVSNIIVGRRITIDRKLYPNAETNADTINNSVRTYQNSDESIGVLAGVQVVLRVKNLIPAIKLNTNFAYTLQGGDENLGDGRGLIGQYRQVPTHSLQWGISLNPIKKLYLNFDNVVMSGWLPKYLNPRETFADIKKTRWVNGYYTLDMIARYELSKNLTSFIKILNVFDTKYGGINATGLDVDLIYTPQMGRNIQVGVSFKLE